jgi:hypothetical protein
MRSTTGLKVNFQRSGGEGEDRTHLSITERQLSGLLGYQLPILSANLRISETYYQSKDEGRLDRRGQLSRLESRWVVVSIDSILHH